jgi:hypothetical protein
MEVLKSSWNITKLSLHFWKRRYAVMAKINKMFLIGLVIVSSFCLSISPVLAPPPTYSDIWTWTPCCKCDNDVTVKQDPSWDWNQAQKDALEAQYAIDDPLGDAVDDSATWVYNCHGYTFYCSWAWIPSAANFESDDLPTPGSGHWGCYYDNASGDYPIWGGGSTHSSHKGPEWGLVGPLLQLYTGKLGMSVEADHTETIYGTHGELWKVKM